MKPTTYNKEVEELRGGFYSTSQRLNVSTLLFGLWLLLAICAGNVHAQSAVSGSDASKLPRGTVIERGLTQDIWISPRTDSVIGVGTAEDPKKVTTSAAFQTVLDDAAAGSTIHAQAGTYPSLNLTISKTVKITGSRQAVFTQATGAGKPIFSLSGATTEFVLEGVTLQHGTGFREEGSVMAIKVVGATDKVKLLGIYSSDFNQTWRDDVGTNELIVRNCDFVYTYGRAGISNVSPYAGPVSSITGNGMKRAIIQNNTFDGLLDSTFAGISGSPPVSQQTPAENFVQIGRADYIDVSGNVVRNHYFEGIFVSRGDPSGTYSYRIANNHIVASNYARGNWFYTPSVALSNCQATIMDNKMSNSLLGVNASFATDDEDLNVVTISGNRMEHVLTGINGVKLSSKSVISGNTIWNTSEPSKTVYYANSGATEFHGIKINNGNVTHNTLIADEPAWDATTTLASRASNVFTLSSVAGITANAGALISYANGSVSYFPVTTISGNDVTISSGWAASYPLVTSGTLYYTQTFTNLPNSGGVVVYNGGTVYADGNIITGYLNDISYLGSGGTVVTSKHTTRDCHFVRPNDATFVRLDPASVFPKFSVSKNAAQAIAQNTFTKLTWQVENFDTNTNFASNTFTPTVAGKYLIEATFYMSSATSGIGGFVSIYKNGSEYRRGSESAATSTGALSGTVNSLLDMNGTTDSVDVYVYQRDSASRDVNGSTNLTYFKGAMMP